MTPVLGGSARRGTVYVRRPGAYAVIVHPRGVLATLQRDRRGLDEMQLPGGGIDPGEGPVAALHREAFEETGWSLRVLRRIGAYRRFVWMPEYRIHAEKVCHVYLARAGLRRGPPSEPGHRAAIVPPRAALDGLASAGDRAMLRRALRIL
ncbi:NUDIX domain-containing protein [Jannaschia sp. Os4]|uniref:NUDIX domain-containing protein n=1 Tax=Jannaschia sp. Os4 TaxID=2807617 RepID=UPI001939CBD6|nr:NUDIX domain-containing protein [Jannaschia sp. Os4]MBM2575392.1 NUDIX domain-containing protein [Jannaschia sp. Os4]